jgi:diketogulonate reductase-like aldo/keto reductase
MVIPSIGLGTWKIDKPVAASVVEAAIKIGYRAIDCASIYGNEEEGKSKPRNN